ncbi:MAG: NAD(P)-dependent alcohol dehydrogenase [Tagaea sp.]|nr:NAD(P)-dependent alcohol dehydrogenase [Tagaea sp.]
MLAAICTAYGGPETVSIRDIPKPAPRAREILIRMRAACVTSGDARVRAANFPPGFAPLARLALGLRGPRRAVLGAEGAGIVEACGRNVTRFEEGDAVFALFGARFGAHAEYAVLPETGAIAPIPRGYSFERAAAIAFGGTTALHFLRDRARVAPGERVLVNGASGSVGSAAVQIARALGARVTGVCSAANAARVRALGAYETIDYAARDFADGRERWNIVFDAVGNAPLSRACMALVPGGRLVAAVAGLGATLGAALRPKRGALRVLAGIVPERAEDLAYLAGLCESGAFDPPIDSTFALADIAQAHARVDTRRKTGAVVVTMPG